MPRWLLSLALLMASVDAADCSAAVFVDGAWLEKHLVGPAVAIVGT